MRIAVAGATGNIGALTVSALEQGGHDVVPISRSLGVDLTTGDGLDAALTGVESVVDVTNSTATDPDGAVAWFGSVSRNLLAAEHRVGVRHHVLLSIAGVDRVAGNAHYAGKREQERLRREGAVPLTIVPVDPVPRLRRHDRLGWTEQDGTSLSPRSWSSPSRPRTSPTSWP